MKKKCLLFLFVNAMVFANTYAQISQGGMPVSFLYPEVSTRYLQAELMPIVNVDRMRQEDAANATDGSTEKRLRFGAEMEVSLDMNSSGITDILPNGDKLWRLAIKSAGANTINLIFSKYYVPAGAQLFIYSVDRLHIIGAFTDLNNQMDQKLGTTLVEGEECIIEYYEPSWVTFAGQIAIGTVVHGYRMPGDEDAERGFGGSGSCNNNANCPEGADWGDQKRSVARIVNGGDWCTGALINNTANDGTPYFLSANHCYTSNFSTWVYWFNYESTGCSNPGTAPTPNTLSGATLKSRNAASDFLLLQLNTTPPTSYNVYYAGWNRSATAGTSSTCIHHPSGDIKKITFDNNTATNGSWAGTPANSHWRVVWDDGVTEGGSSGSPLFDQNKRIVGQLHGGASFCGGSDLSDEYGKFNLSWDLGTTTATRLKEWLDPSNTSVTVLDGLGAGTSNFLTVTPSNQNAGSASGSAAFNVSSNVNWTASTSASWISLSPSSGSNNATITASYSTNTGTATRAGSVTITDGIISQTVTITQQGTSQSTCTNGDEPSNNTRTNAPVIAFNTDKNSIIASSTDKDFWKFTLSTSTSVTITLGNLPADFDLRLRNSGGTILVTAQNGGTSSESITTTLVAGTYYANVYGYNGAFSTTQCYLLRVNTSSGIVPLEGINDKVIGSDLPVGEFRMFPNPTNDFTTIEYDGYATVELYDGTGKLVFAKSEFGKTQFDFTNLPYGIYIVKVNQNGKISTKKLVVEK